MSIRFLADENIEAEIVRILRSREPAIEILDVKTAGLDGTKDPALLELAAEEDRILISHDRNTMTRHLYDRIKAGKSTPGLFIIPKQPSAIGQIVESLLLIWSASEPAEWRDQIVYLPFR